MLGSPQWWSLSAHLTTWCLRGNPTAVPDLCRLWRCGWAACRKVYQKRLKIRPCLSWEYDKPYEKHWVLLDFTWFYRILPNNWCKPMYCIVHVVPMQHLSKKSKTLSKWGREARPQPATSPRSCAQCNHGPQPFWSWDRVSKQPTTTWGPTSVGLTTNLHYLLQHRITTMHALTKPQKTYANIR